MRFPHFDFYAGDWANDANNRCLSLAEKGAHIELLCLMWNAATEESFGIVDNAVGISRALGISENEWLEMRAVMVDGPYAVLHTENGRLVSKRLQREWRAACEKSEKAKASRSQRQADQKATTVPTNVPTNVERSLDDRTYERTHERTHERTTSHQSSVIKEKEREIVRAQSLTDDYPVLAPLADILGPWESDLAKRTADRDYLIQCLTVHRMEPALVRAAFDQAANAGASSVAYVTKCLRGWQKKGWHTALDKDPIVAVLHNRSSPPPASDPFKNEVALDTVRQLIAAGEAQQAQKETWSS